MSALCQQRKSHPFFRSTVTQLAQQPGQVHFRISGLKAALERGLDALLGLRVAHAFGKEIGIATEVLDRRQRNCIDPVLDRDAAGDKIVIRSLRRQSAKNRE
jgi:hypothetical protein